MTYEAFAFVLGSKLGSNMLSLPIYLRANSYYLHTRYKGKQIKRSLYTTDKFTAIARAHHILSSLKGYMDLSKLRKYEIDLERGVLKSDGVDDHRRMMEALTLLKGLGNASPTASSKGESSASGKGLRLIELLDKFFLLKTHLKPATILSYKNTINEFSEFLNKTLVENIGLSDVTRFQEYLAKKKNQVRTIDNKVATIRALMNFAIKQGYYFNANPAGNRSIMTKRQKNSGGYEIFEEEEIKLIYQSQFFKNSKNNDPDYYWAIVIGLFTGCRISEITSLTAEQFKVSNDGVPYIRIIDSKTNAGLREIPLPNFLIENGLADFIKDKKQVFKYKLRLGKGSGNAVGKKFARHLSEVKVTREKLVFHSLRKFANNFAMNNGMKFEPRCQMFGHETNSVNIDIYTNKIPIDGMVEHVGTFQIKLLKLVGMI